MTDHLPAFDIDITPESASRWLMGRDGAFPPRVPVTGDAVPLSYLFFLRSQPAAGISIHAELGRDPDRGLFGGVRYERHRGIRVGDRLTADARVTERKTVESPRGDMVLTTLVNEWRAGEDLAVTETVRMVDLPPGPPSAPAAGPEADSALSSICDPVSFTRTQIAWLTVETGDTNALHLDRDYALSRQFPDVVVPGTLIVPVAEKALSATAGMPLQMLDVRFRAPTFPEENIVVKAIADGKPDTWRFEVVGDGGGGGGGGGGTVRAVGRASIAADPS